MKALITLISFSLLTFAANANEVEFDTWKPLTKLGEIEVESRIGKIDGKVVERQVRARNYFSTDVCILSKIKKTLNAKSDFVNDGKMIVEAGAETYLGSYGAIRKGKHWKARWEYRATKNLDRCL